MFASAFVLILVDIIIPAASEQWDLSKTFTLMDEMMLRGIIVAGPYKKDLIEMDELRQRLKRTHVVTAVESIQPPDPPPAIPDPRMTAPSMPYPPLEQDMIWSWMGTGDTELGVLHPDTIQSAIDGLNFDFLNDPSGLDMDGSEWMWGSSFPAGSSTPNQL